MKKIFTLLTMIMFSCYAFSQNIEQINASKQEAKIKPYAVINDKTPTDTIFLNEFFNVITQAYNYLAPGYGYIFGPHWDSLSTPRAVETAQGYIFDSVTFTGYAIEEALIWTSIKGQASVNGSNLYVKVSKLNGTSSYTIGGTPYTITCPGTLLRTDTVLWNDIDTSSTGWTIANFDPPIYVSANYAIALNVSNFYTNGDTLSVIGGEPCASGIYGYEYTFYKYPSPSLWAQFSHIWTSGGNPIDAAIAIFPVVDRDYVGIESNYFANGLKMSCNPNPVKEDAIIQYALENEANVTLEVYNIKGQRVFNFEEGIQTAGLHSITICANQLSNGTYYYSLKTDNSRLTKKMIVTK